MCGIVGYVGKKNAIKVIISGLETLEYRGYDSAGIAYRNVNNELKIIENGGHTYYLNNGRKLISVSAITKLFGSKYLEIPEYILSKAKEAGEAIHNDIQSFLNGNEPKQSTIEFYKWKLSNTKGNILGFEKLIYDNTFIGFIDIDLEDCFIELKTRTTDNVLDIETVLQCEVYKRIINKPYHIVNINRKTNKVVELKPTEEQIKQVNEFIDKFVELSKVIEWK